MAKLRFPDGFLWGSGTSAFQVEGNTPPCNWTKGAEEGFVPVIGKAADHYRLYREDFDTAKELGHTAHRFSIEWSRIEPEDGVFDEKEIAHYRDVLVALKVRGMEPMVTLWHFTIPQWLVEKGGAESKDFPRYFARYCARVVEALGEEARYWITINEPLPFANNGWLRGSWPPFKKWWLNDVIAGFGYPARGLQKRPKGTLRTYLRVRRHLAAAHNKAYVAMKEKRSGISVGIAKHAVYFHANSNPLNWVLARFMNWFWTYSFMNRIAQSYDFIGVNQYFDKKFGEKKTFPKTDMGWNINPPGLYGALMLFSRYEKPVFVTENGIADATDTKRASFIRDNLREVYRAIEDGLQVQGYFYWSLLDNYELAEGYEKRFGLVEVNFKTQERRIRDSAHVYAKICRENALES